MIERRERRSRWVQRGRYAVQVEIEVLHPEKSLDDPCLEPKTVRWLDQVARRVESGDLNFLKSVGRVFVAVDD